MKHLGLLFFSLLFCINLPSQDLVSAAFLESRTKDQMVAEFGTFMQNGIHMYKLTYTTSDVFGQVDTASGLLVIPDLEASIFPHLIYQHGTVSGREDVPSNLRGGYQLAAVWGAMGYFTTAADYIGLGTSRGLHPYVHADSEASAAIDLLFAARQFAETESVALNEQLFITGYSQGGHGAAAAHKKIQEEYEGVLTVTASAPMSGPYSISGEMKKVILAESEYLFPAYVHWTTISYNLVYGLYDNIDQYFKQPYGGMLEQFIAEEIDLNELNNMLIDQLNMEYGKVAPRFMFQDSIVQAVETDENHPVNVALRANDLFDWAPQAPTRLYYCGADEQVAFRNSVVADSVMSANGAPDVLAINMDNNANHGGCVEPAVIAGIFFFGAYQDIGVISNTTEANQLPIRHFPNPVKDILYLENIPNQAQFTLLDLQGRVLHQQQLQPDEDKIALPSLSNGLYIASINSPEGGWTRKVFLNGEW